MTPAKVKISGQGLAAHLDRVTSAHRDAYAATEAKVREHYAQERAEPAAESDHVEA